MRGGLRRRDDAAICAFERFSDLLGSGWCIALYSKGVSGTSAVLDSEDTEYLHKGIAERNFVRTFKLAEFVEVAEAKLEDGILRVSLFRNVPDAMKPQKIKIS